MNSLSLRARYLLALGLLLMLIAGSAAVTASQLATIQTENERLHAALRLDGALKRLDGAIGEEEAAVYAPSSSDPSLRSAFQRGEFEVAADITQLEPYAAAARYAPSIHLLFDTVLQWRTWAKASTESAAGGGAAPPLGQGARLLENYREASGRLESMVADDARAETSRAADQTAWTIGLLLLFAMTVAATLVALSAVFLRSTLAPMRHLALRASALAQGDELAEIGPARRSDEVGDLQNALATWQALSRERLSISRTLSELSSGAGAEELAAIGGELVRVLFGASLVSVVAAGREGPRLLHRAGFRIDGEALAAQGGADLLARLEARVIDQAAVVRTELDSGEWDKGSRRLARELGLGPCIALPLRVGGSVVGAVTAVRLAGSPGFTELDVQRSDPVVAALAGALGSALVIEELREAKARLERADSQKNEFVASMSHEFRTPLNAVLGFTQLLLMETAGTLTERQHRYVANVETAGRHLLALINDLLDLAKVEAGRMEVRSEPVDLEEAVRPAIQQLQPAADGRAVELGLQLDCLPEAIGDRLRIQQVVLNLVSNAIKFTPAGGRVTVRVAATGVYAEIVVSDTGIGIAADQLGAIFEPFTQIEGGRTRREQGTGLGLSLTRRLVELMGGTIEVKSTVSHGSDFTVRLPLAESRREAVTR